MLKQKELTYRGGGVWMHKGLGTAKLSDTEKKALKMVEIMTLKTSNCINNNVIVVSSILEV